MTSGETERAFDVTVIGAGIGGLTAAALLSRAGKRVCVLEQADQPGGYLAGFERQGFHFDSAIHWLNQCGPGGLVRKIFDFIGPDAPRTLAQSRIRRVKGETFDYLLTDDPDQLKNRLIREFPHEKSGIIRFFRAAASTGEAFRNSAVIARTTRSMGFPEKIAHHLKTLRIMLPLLRYLSSSAEKGLAKFFSDDRLKRIFSTEERLLSCLVPIGWSYTGDFHHAPVSGSAAFAHWLTGILNRSGNEVRLGHRVVRVLLDHGRACGVIAENGSMIREIHTDTVVAACDSHHLYRHLLPPRTVSRAFLKNQDRADVYPSAFSIYLGLDCDPATLGLGPEIICLAQENIPRSSQHGSDPETTAISVLSPSLRDPSLAPPGKGTLVIFTQAAFDHADTWHTERNADGIVRGADYRTYKNHYADILMARVRRALIPDLEKHVVVREIATPVTFFRYTGNRKGSMMGARPGFRNMRAGVAHYRTPVKNLYLSGHWAEYGGGIPSAVRAALNTVLLILKSDSRPAFRILSRFADGKISAAEASAAMKQLQNAAAG